MKIQTALLALACFGGACQHSAPPAQAPVTHAAAGVPVTPKATPTAPAIVSDSLTPAMRATLRQVDISKLFLAPEPGTAADYQSVLDGFFGKNPQRLSLAILQAERDSLHPGLFHAVGKARYRQEVTGFEGIIRITNIADYHDQSRLLTQAEDTFVQDTTDKENGGIVNARAYSATAAFSFTSTSALAAYALTGQVKLDFWLTDKGKAGMLRPPCEGCVDDKSPTKGSGLLLQGIWQDAATKAKKPFIVGRDVFFLSPGVIQDFGIGDRSSQINPKYAKLGWKTYWKNDEWWADSPKPSLNL